MAQPDWLDRAASHSSTKWLKEFLRSRLPQLQDQTISPQDFALALSEDLEGRRLMSPERQKNYRSNVCQALKELDAHHPAIALVSPTADEYRAMNDAQRGKLAERETKFFTSGQAEALVERATGLLDSREWSEVAAGLAVLMGRRISEILLSGFEVRSPWSLTFSEMAKKQGVEGLSIEIPTLAPAERVLAAIERLQRILMIEDLKAASLSPKMAKQKVNGRFSEAVASQCHSHFADLVPARTDRETLYTHLFRAVYATIAAHWFCPPTVPEHLFKAEIQGHFTLSQEGRKLPNYSARANYDDYAIGTLEGNRDGRLGIKLGTLPGLQVIEAFRKPRVLQEEEAMTGSATRGIEAIEVEAGGEAMEVNHGIEPIESQTEAVAPVQASGAERSSQVVPKASEKGKTKRPELRVEDLDRMVNSMLQCGITGSLAEVFGALLDKFEESQSQQQLQQARSVEGLTSNFAWFTQRIDRLEGENLRLRWECDQLLQERSTSEVVEGLRLENQRLEGELQQYRAVVVALQNLPGRAGGEGSSVQVRGAEAIKETLTAESEQPKLTPAPAPLGTGAGRTGSPKVEMKEGQPREPKAETAEKINAIVDEILKWNSAQELDHRRLRVSIPVIRPLASLLGASNQQAIQWVLEQRKAEVEGHHEEFGITPRHNAAVRDVHGILKTIAQEMGLENWENVRKPG